MIRKILFATDFSPHSKEALNYTADLARKLGSSIIGAHALKIPASIYSFQPPSEGHLDEVEEACRTRLQFFFQVSQLKNLQVETRLVFGVPEQAVNRLAVDEKVDLLVVGKHSRSALQRFLVGSTVEAILRAASRPALVVPDHGQASIKWNPVVCAVDFSHAGSETLSYAVRFARATSASLLVLNAVDFGPGMEAARGKVRERMETIVQSARKKLTDWVSAAGAPRDTRVQVSPGKPSTTLLKTTRDADSDLLIMSACRHAVGKGMGLGSTASAVLQGASFPVLLVPSQL